MWHCCWGNQTAFRPLRWRRRLSTALKMLTKRSRNGGYSVKTYENASLTSECSFNCLGYRPSLTLILNLCLWFFLLSVCLSLSVCCVSVCLSVWVCLSSSPHSLLSGSSSIQAHRHSLFFLLARLCKSLWPYTDFASETLLMKELEVGLFKPMKQLIRNFNCITCFFSQIQSPCLILELCLLFVNPFLHSWF